MGSTAIKSFNEWNIMAHRIIFNSLGQNFILKDWKLALEFHPWFQPLKIMSKNLTREYKRIETTKKSTTVSDSNAFDVVFLKWQDEEINREELLELLIELD